MASSALTPAFWADAHRGAMLAGCLRTGLSRSDADDAVQDAMLKLFRAALPDLSRNPRAYAVTTAIRVAIDLRRERRRRPTVAYDAAVHDRAVDASPEIDPELVHRVEVALASAPEAYGEAIRLVAEGLTYPEIAERTGAPVGTVRSRIHRGRKILAPLLNAA